MFRRPILFAIPCPVLLLMCCAVFADFPLESINRKINKEPQYSDQPQYLLLALGTESPALVWLVEDGRKLYIDQNANGDLTDDGPALEPADERSWQRNVDSPDKSWDFQYELASFAPPGRPEQTNFKLHRWNYGDSKQDGYGLELTLDGKVPMYAGWTPFWSKSPDKASIIHFGGPLTPRTLRFKEFVVGGKMDRMSFAFMNRGLGKGADARLSIDAMTADVLPEAVIRWPTNEGGPPLETTHTLNQRCCYWEFYLLHFDVPADVVPGTAKATIKLPSGALQLLLATDTIDIPVVSAPEDKSSPSR